MLLLIELLLFMFMMLGFAVILMTDPQSIIDPIIEKLTSPTFIEFLTVMGMIALLIVCTIMLWKMYKRAVNVAVTHVRNDRNKNTFDAIHRVIKGAIRLATVMFILFTGYHAIIATFSNLFLLGVVITFSPVWILCPWMAFKESRRNN